jgi:23S rRNA pseudouridine2605 synthase
MAERSTSHRIRLNKYLADCGIASRRKADEMIENGEVTINGKKVFELGIRVDPKMDRILFRGKPVQAQNRFVYYAFYKPKNVVTTTEDPHGRMTVMDYFPKSKLRLFPVGRLDWDAEGLLIITNDGEFAQKVIHPDEQVSKTYHVKLDGLPTDMQLEKLRRGVSIVGGKVAALHIKRLANKSTDKKGWVEVVIDEGKNHQVKQMFAKIGFDVVKLRRVAIGEFRIGSLQSGEFRELTFEQIHKIFKRRKSKKDEKSPTKSGNKSTIL